MPGPDKTCADKSTCPDKKAAPSGATCPDKKLGATCPDNKLKSGQKQDFHTPAKVEDKYKREDIHRDAQQFPKDQQQQRK